MWMSQTAEHNHSDQRFLALICIFIISVPPPPVCPPSWFVCDSGECIEERKVCDFTLHCPHGEDEASCRKTLI